MKLKHKKILEILEDYLKKNPKLRFGQALYNLNILQFADKDNPSNKDFLMKDIHQDSDDEIYNRIRIF